MHMFLLSILRQHYVKAKNEVNNFVESNLVKFEKGTENIYIIVVQCSLLLIYYFCYLEFGICYQDTPPKTIKYVII